jgi:hypothetical protein
LQLVELKQIYYIIMINKNIYRMKIRI